jgi:hypothetical protein
MGKLLLSVLLGVFALQPQIVNHSGISNSANINVAPPALLTWEMLFKVIFVQKYSNKYKMKVNVPEFDYSLQQLNHKEVIIAGFAIPTSVGSSNFVLSQNPFSSCYFCGNGGVETVMTIKYKGKAPRYKTDDYITLKGTLELNSTNIDELIYVLTNATQVK